MNTHVAIASDRLKKNNTSRVSIWVGSLWPLVSGKAAWGLARGQLSLIAIFGILVLALVFGSGCGSSKKSKPSSPADAPSVKVDTPSTIEGVAIPKGELDESLVDASITDGEQLFRRHCAACHGESGDGNGPAALFLHPKPRNFLEGSYRLVTTTNLAPSDEDLARVLERGIPGSAMIPFAHLDDEEQATLVAYVRQLTRQGLEDRLRLEAEEFGDEIDPEELAMILNARTEPGAPLEVPADWPAPNEQSLKRGRVLYVESCLSCHGETGRGDGQEEQRDEFGFPIRPRDFTRGIFKGGREHEQLYARIMLGAPGTPMPATPTLTPEDVGNLVNYVLSLSEGSGGAGGEHRRTWIVAQKSEEFFNYDIPDSVWDVVSPESITISPLWWRDDAPVELQVQAIHDGQTLALRLSWLDPSRDDSAVRVDEFPDLAAVQLYQGEHEPFLGMGEAGTPVEVWLWNAAAERDRVQFADVDTVHPDMVVDEYPFEEPGDTPDTHPTAHQPREFLTAWAAGNLRSDPTQSLAASSLQIEGFGSSTLRPAPSQVVQAHGDWSAGRWTVVLQRLLHVSPETGMALDEATRCSIAFAIWDGAARDRNGQKLISIWHDLELE